MTYCDVRPAMHVHDLMFPMLGVLRMPFSIIVS